MGSFGDHYILASDRSGHDRLRMLCEIHDPQTRALLLKAGLNGKHRFVEFGCGLGYVARWAATQASHVTAIELSEDHLAEARRLGAAENLHNIEWVNRSIYDHGLPENSFGYGYTRWILTHLTRPLEAMRRVFEALRPGGIFVCEEPDLSTLYTEPASAAYLRCQQLVVAAAAQRGQDHAAGRRLHSWAREVGFEVLEVGAYQLHHLRGPQKAFWSWSFLEAGASLLAQKAVEEEELKEMAAGMCAADADPNVLVGHCRNHQLIARKPLSNVGGPST